MMPEERLQELGPLRLETLIEDITIKNTPVRNKLFSKFLTTFPGLNPLLLQEEENCSPCPQQI